MDKDKQRIAIAEACGWTLIGLEPLTGELEGLRPNSRTNHRTDLPDYLNDLNAMHEAEAFMEGKLKFRVDTYMSFIGAVILREAGLRTNGHCGSYRIVHATAAQRAEAFLKTLNLWIGNQN